MNLKKIGKVFTSKFVGTGPSSYKKKRIYRAAVSQKLRNTGLGEILPPRCPTGRNEITGKDCRWHGECNFIFSY